MMGLYPPLLCALLFIFLNKNYEPCNIIIFSFVNWNVLSLTEQQMIEDFIFLMTSIIINYPL